MMLDGALSTEAIDENIIISSLNNIGLNLAALKDMTESEATTPHRFWQVANKFGFTFNWAYVSRKFTSFFSSGLLPRRPRGLDRRLPTIGDGSHEWTGFLGEREHPHDTSGPGGLLLNWNNKPAKGWTAADDAHGYGSVHRVEMFDHWKKKPRIQDVVSVMNRAATEDMGATEVWPVVRAMLDKTPAPNARAAQAAAGWRGPPRGRRRRR